MLRGAARTIALLAASACFTDGPVGMFPGGAFADESQPCPVGTQWRAFAGELESELEVRPKRPRSVTTWNLVHEDAFYVPADFITPLKFWPEQVLADPRVRVRIAGQVFACTARREEDPARIEAIRAAMAAKYELEPDGLAARTEVWWFELVPRTSRQTSSRATSFAGAVRRYDISSTSASFARVAARRLTSTSG